VSKTFDGRTTEYVWDGDDLVHERVRAADGTVASPVVTWVSEPGAFTPLAKLEGRKRWGIVTDHLGTPTMLATEAGKIAWQAQLDVYGVVREEALASPGTGNDAAPESERTGNPWRYPGQYEDAETGLYYNRFRYYDPETGRYLSEDPIGLAGGVASYGYVGAPNWWVDPFGLKKCNIEGKTKKGLQAVKPEGPGWHMHHIVMEGAFSHWKPENRRFVEEARELLVRNKVNLQEGLNVVWAKNEGHSVQYAKDVHKALHDAEKKGGTKAVVEALEAMKQGLLEKGLKAA
jgi:RHS repeat-associated protein